MTEKDIVLYIDLDRLPQFGENVAKSMQVNGTVSASGIARETLVRLKSIKETHSRATEFAAGAKWLPQEIEWLLDNWYIAEREGKEAWNALKHVKKINCSLAGKRPVVWEMATALVRAGRNEITQERIQIFLDSFQNVLVLSECELSIIIPVIKATLIAALEKLTQRLDQVMRGILSRDEKNPFYAEVTARNLREEGKEVNEKLGRLALEAKRSHEDLILFMRNIFTSLRFLADLDASKMLECVNRTEETLLKDPAGIYSKLNESTRRSYRQEISRLAKKKGLAEYEAAKRILKLAKESKHERHVGHYIFKKPFGVPMKRRTGEAYIGGILVFSLFLTLLIGMVLNNLLVSLLLFFPISEIVKNLIDYAVLRMVRPKPVHRLELSESVPTEGRTLCVISALLSSAESGKRYGQLLEEYRLANRDCGSNLLFGILADIPEAKCAHLDEDEKILIEAREEIERLNRQYGGGFYLLYRERSFNARDKRYLGWERKRGAILELVRLLKGQKTGLRCETGSKLGLSGVKYIITLDGDTRLCVGSAKELIGAMLHPLNTAVIDPEKKIVTEGYGILQPRISVNLSASGKSDFTRIFAGRGGIDPYSSNAGDVYHDLFGEGSFSGKGILDVDAFYTCLNQAFPENTILSHDLLEGSYLRTAYIGDVELTDGYPYKLLSYYERMHRWTRGDWQNIPWLLGKVKNAGGERVKNHLKSINRWKIFDNLRRSLVPVFTFFALYIGMLSSDHAFVWAAAAALISMASNLLITGAFMIFRRNRGGRARYHSAIISGFAGGLMQTLILFILLPYQAFVCAHAIVTALYRSLISRKNMLSWVTAADAERNTGDGVVTSYRKMYASVLLGLGAILFSLHASGIAVGIIWVLSPLYAVALSKEIRYTRNLNQEERLFLLSAAGDIWRYFHDFIGPKDNYLPPDNWQEQPATGIAHRTSPTNIGLCLLSALSALDLDLCTKTEALSVIANTMKTVERLPKWNGHLYNWYDTETLRPLNPAYVSTVDSGNFVGCLIALAQGLSEMADPLCEDLSRRAMALVDEMSFVPLYDRERKLFYIGWDMEKRAPTQSWYDLMASEARQTSFIAVARGDVDKKHWRRLGRALVSQDNYSGMASWTGTMFEYFMPNLLMPCYRNSLIYESLKFCVYVQKRRARNLPWGFSESAFYAFDPALNYRYKAHGVQRLALKRGLNKEMVVSPYSSFLALPVDMKGVIENLTRIRKMGGEGRYGFYEAIDFTPNRQTESSYEVVKTYMAHHLGMSLLSIANLLCDNVMQKRFMRDISMSAYAELLQEQVPVRQVVLRQPPREVPDKPQRSDLEGWCRRKEGYDFWRPGCTLLSNGAYHVMLTETGLSHSTWNGLMTTKFEPVQTGGAGGMRFYLKRGKELLSLQPAPDFDGEMKYASVFCGHFGEILAGGRNVESRITVQVPSSDMGEVRKVCIKNNADRAEELELVCYFEPVLAPAADYFSHMAFSKLSVETELFEDVIIVKRRQSGKKSPAYMGFCVSHPMEFDTSREAALGRGGERRMLSALNKPAGGTLGSVLDPCVLVRIPLKLQPGADETVSFALSVAGSREDACRAASRILGKQEGNKVSRIDGIARQLGLGYTEIEGAMDRISDLVFNTGSRRTQETAIRNNREGRNGLWRFGISGDLPVMTGLVSSEAECTGALKLICQHNLLAQNGLRHDLVLLTGDGGDYRRPIRTYIADSLRALGKEYELGAFGGVHLVEHSRDTESILAASALVFDLSKKTEVFERHTELLPKAQPPYLLEERESIAPECKWDGDNSVIFETGSGMPQNAWGHMLANEEFGFFATDAGTGHMWHKNARENKLNSWRNDALSTDGAETLELCTGGRRYSLFAHSDGCPCTVTYGFGFARWEKVIGAARVKTTAFVPPDTAARVFIIEMENTDKLAEISYATRPVLGADEGGAAYVETMVQGGVLSAKNNYNTEFPGGGMYLLGSVSPKGFTCNLRSRLTGDLDGAYGAGFAPCLAAVYSQNPVLVLVTGCGELNKLKNLAVPARAFEALEDTRLYWKGICEKTSFETPDEGLNRYINGWAIYQTLACRIFGRSSLYQNGGAYGFRDQLQDVSALIALSPERVRAQIKNACTHQFEEGDVQHWWHPGGVPGQADKGVRTRCSDDLLWLPYLICEYAEKTGDMAFLREPAGYIAGRPLEQDEHERYDSPQLSQVYETVFEHGRRALELVLKRGAGQHGLALMGTGDWNDGMNLVGAGGSGESVWLTWFLAHTLNRYAELCEKNAGGELARRYREEAARYTQAANEAWDGNWFLRGYYDDGSTLGSSLDEECQIDSIAQSFSVWVQGADREKARAALKSAVSRLFDRDNRFVKLFTPAFAQGEKNPGYIRGYAPGVRENGGQYTHGAIWLAKALLMAGDAEEGYELLKAILPGGRSPEYRVEPYVLPADIYSNPQHTGRGGWSWYTGAAGWYYRTAVEDLLGLSQRDGRLYIEPNLPSGWQGYTARFNSGQAEYEIQVQRRNGYQITVNGDPYDGKGLPLFTERLAVQR